MILNNSSELLDYKPNWLLRSGHTNTIYPTLFRRISANYTNREEITLEDGDFLHVDTVFDGNRRLAILCHGLEGSSYSKYIIGASKILQNSDWDIAAVNYRGCSGVKNKSVQMYHSGKTDDLHQVVMNYTDKYTSIVLIGFSLGGNLILKYCGESLSDNIKNLKMSVAISVPIHLESASRRIGDRSNWIYEKRFLGTLKEKIRAKHKQFPNEINLNYLDRLESLYDFDDYYTSRLHGFENAQDYYDQCSAIKFINNIQIPSLHHQCNG